MLPERSLEELSLLKITGVSEPPMNTGEFLAYARCLPLIVHAIWKISSFKMKVTKSDKAFSILQIILSLLGIWFIDPTPIAKSSNKAGKVSKKCWIYSQDPAHAKKRGIFFQNHIAGI